MIISLCVRVAADDILFFFWLSNTPLYVYMCHVLFIQPPVDGRVGCFLVLAIVNSAAVNTGVHAVFSNWSFYLFQVYALEWDCWIVW